MLITPASLRGHVGVFWEPNVAEIADVTSEPGCRAVRLEKGLSSVGTARQLEALCSSGYCGHGLAQDTVSNPVSLRADCRFRAELEPICQIVPLTRADYGRNRQSGRLFQGNVRAPEYANVPSQTGGCDSRRSRSWIGDRQVLICTCS